MAKTVQERSAKTARKRVALAEEELRLRVRPGTRQALADLMEWSGITEQGETMMLMIHHLHALGSAKCQPLLNPPRHEIEISENVARDFHSRSLAELRRDPSDESVAPKTERPDLCARGESRPVMIDGKRNYL
ncbi:hypothetical protein [Pseudomonas gessardii]|uniref:Prophage PSSB64-02 n=1 Tax=Pseudomonas gessardii TaxID=78544 RepID=A0A7Y1MVS5_9PSED|nr:hypothetical protein [Pseudomonas gessardii]NNA99276.1 hypothetical protein [Pseudomonas gessardii]